MTQSERMKAWWAKQSPERVRELMDAMRAKYLANIKNRIVESCIVAGCERPHFCRDLCAGHYQQLRRKGRVYRMELRPHVRHQKP